MNLVIDKTKEKTKLPKVMRAALKLFIKKGIDGTTIRDIAKKAHVAEGALYRHFKSKEELAFYIFSTNLNEFSVSLLKNIEAQKTVKEKTKAYISVCFTYFEEDRDLFTYLLISEHQELDRFPSKYLHPGHVALKIIEEGQKTGELKKMNIYVAGSILVGSLIRLCAVRMYGNIKENLSNYENDVFLSIWDALKN